MPNIICRPVVDGGCAPNILKLPADPALSPISIFLVQKSTVSLAVTHLLSFPKGKPSSCFHGTADTSVQIALPKFLPLSHIDMSSSDCFPDRSHTLCQASLEPRRLFLIVPGIPVHFITAECGSSCHGQTNPVGNSHFILYPLKSTFNVSCCHCVLGFKILMKYPNSFIRIIFLLNRKPDSVKDRCPCRPKRQVNIIKLLKYEFQTILQGFIHILFQIFPYQ